jgi:ADP-ribose pyrophosphatase YjhB (NUDIX family)
MSTHAGGIVVKETPRGPAYLVVRARQDPWEWIFPKGRIERGETPEVAAAREVRDVRVGMVAHQRHVSQLPTPSGPYRAAEKP